MPAMRFHPAALLWAPLLLAPGCGWRGLQAPPSQASHPAPAPAPGPAPAPVADVYVAGYEYLGGVNVATVWKNGRPMALPDGAGGAIAQGVAVSGTDVYVVGTGYARGTGSPVARLWKNGVLVEPPLTDGLMDPLHDVTEGVALALAVSGPEVTVLGCARNDTRQSVPLSRVIVWRNGKARRPLAGEDASATSLALSGQDVYVAGNAGSASGICWRNGEVLFRTDGRKVVAFSALAVSGSEVFVAGTEAQGRNMVATVWRNGTATRLPGGPGDASVQALALSGAEVIAAGQAARGQATVARVWRNGTATDLTDGTRDAGANAMVLAGSDLYVAGFDAGQARCWRNGVAGRHLWRDRWSGEDA